MNIRPSAAIRQNYNEIADMCRKTEEPIFLTKNGEGDLVVMDIETYNRWEKMLKLRVLFPGLTPGINPLFLFKSSDIWVGLIVIAV